MSRSRPPGQPRDVLLNVDLLGLTPVYMTQLDRWRPFFRCAVEEAFVRRLIHRYEDLWLPLLASWQQLDLEPPADIHWIWQLHLLQPNHYSAYCLERFGRVLPHRIRKYDREAATALQRTASLWRDTYPGTLFEADLDYLKSDGAVQPNGTKLADLVAVAVNEREFLYQIGLPHYRDQSFQYAAVERYKKLLLFKTRRPGANLRVPVDVQLVWRVHLLHPTQFAEDMRRIFGYPLCGLGDMDFEAHHILLAESNNAWREEFGDELFVEGAGYRGHGSTSADIHSFPRDSYDRRTIETCEISIANLTIDEIWTKEKKIVVEAMLIGDNSFAQQMVFRTTGTVGGTMRGDGLGSSKAASAAAAGGGEGMVGRTQFDTRRNKGLEFHIIGRKGLGCISRERTIATKLFNPTQYFQNLNAVSGGTQHIVLPKVTYTDPKISFEMAVRAAASKPHIFTLDRNSSELCPLPPEFRQFVTNSQAWNAAMISPVENNFLKARHSLKCREAGIAFGVEVIKHEMTNLGAILLYHNNQRLVSVAYSIDGAELPSRIQVLETCPVAFEPHDGDHAMLIRNQLGDFAVCIARWQGSSVGGESRVVILTYFIQSRVTQSLEIRDDELQSIKSDVITVDLPTGRLTVDSACDWLPEQITWAFCVGTLFVVAQKTSAVPYPSSLSTGSVRSAQWSSVSDPDVESIGTATTKKSKLSAKAHIHQKKLAKRRKMSASFTFLLACGLQIDAALYGSSSRPPSSRGSPAAHRLPVNFQTDPDEMTLTFVRNEPPKQLGNGVTMHHQQNDPMNAERGFQFFPPSSLTSSHHSIGQNNVNGSSARRRSSRQVASSSQSGRQVAPPTQTMHGGVAEYYVDVRL